MNYEKSCPNSSFTKKVLYTSDTTIFIFIKRNNVWQVLYQQTQYVASLPPTHTMCDKSFTSRHRVWHVLYQQTQRMQSPLTTDKMCSKSSTNRHDVWQKHLQSKMNSHLQHQVTQKNISAKLKIQIKTLIQETKLSITVADIANLYRNCSLHILNHWITDPAFFKDDKFKYQHYYFSL